MLIQRRIGDPDAPVTVEEIIQACSQELETHIQEFRRENMDADAQSVMQHLAFVYDVHGQNRNFFLELTKKTREEGQQLRPWHLDLHDRVRRPLENL